MKPGRATWNDLGAAYLANWMYSSARQIIVIVVAVKASVVDVTNVSRKVREKFSTASSRHVPPQSPAATQRFQSIAAQARRRVRRVRRVARSGVATSPDLMRQFFHYPIPKHPTNPTTCRQPMRSSARALTIQARVVEYVAKDRSLSRQIDFLHAKAASAKHFQSTHLEVPRRGWCRWYSIRCFGNSWSNSFD